LIREIEDVFGIPRCILEEFVIFEKRKGEFWITSADAHGTELLGLVRKGFRFASLHSKGFRLSFFAILLFGRYATRNFVELNEDERERFIRGEDLPNRWCNLKGQVIVRYRGIPLGGATVTGDTLKNQVPRAARVRASLSV